MAGTPSNVQVWPDADVLIADVDAVGPASVDDDWPVDWSYLGLLDGDAGFVESREEDTADHYAWGGIFVRRTRRQFRMTGTFTAIEYNSDVRSLVYPQSADGQIVVPRPQRVKVGQELREGTKIKRRWTAYQAEVEINGDITESEGEPTRYELLINIFPTAEGVLWTEQIGELAPVNGNGNGG